MQLIVYVLSEVILALTYAELLVFWTGTVPDQSPAAVHEVVLLDTHVKNTESPELIVTL